MALKLGRYQIPLCVNFEVFITELLGSLPGNISGNEEMELGNVLLLVRYWKRQVWRPWMNTLRGGDIQFVVIFGIGRSTKLAEDRERFQTT